MDAPRRLRTRHSRDRTDRTVRFNLPDLHRVRPLVDTLRTHRAHRRYLDSESLVAPDRRLPPGLDSCDALPASPYLELELVGRDNLLC